MADQVGGIRWRSAGATHVGTVRKVNEDSLLDQPDLGLWVVADGMGGHDAGDVASRAVVQSFHDLEPPTDRDASLEEVLYRLQDVNGALQDYAAKNSMQMVGSTVVVLFGFGREFTCLWAGDSRIYQLRDGQLKQLTRDHSQVEEMVNLGLLDRSEAEDHPISNVITRAVGAAESLAVDMVSHTTRPGDRYLLCSDGLNKVMPDAEIAEILRDTPCAEAPQALLHRALDNGTRDNVTAVVVHVEEDGEIP